jgi:ubiquinone/menaquinone biosynthesis C-methylase UbiE
MGAADAEYALGRSQQEYARLIRQAALAEPMTRRLFEEAGIASGMRALEIGSGTGDVCMLLSEIVGATGSVTGVELDANVAGFARERVAALGFRNITFVPCEFSQYEPEATFDAIVGRSVLMYQADPAATLAKAARHLRSGGAVAFMEPWMIVPQGPDTPVKRVASCIVETLRRSGAHIDLGPRLHKVFKAAGLPQPNMRFEALIDGSDESPLYQHCADAMASLLPRAIEHGVVSLGDIDVGNIPECFRVAMNAVGYAMSGMPTVLAWCSTA